MKKQLGLKTNNNPFANLKLSQEEQELENTLEADLYESDADFKQTKLMLREAAENYSYLNKSKPITIRVNQLDLIKLKAKAKRREIPYQTLLSALIHYYADNKLEIGL